MPWQNGELEAMVFVYWLSLFQDLCDWDGINRKMQKDISISPVKKQALKNDFVSFYRQFTENQKLTVECGLFIKINFR